MSPEISTRRVWPPSGVVHEMAERGVKTLCGRDLPDPWVWTDDPTTCRLCLAREARDRDASQESAPKGWVLS